MTPSRNTQKHTSERTNVPQTVIFIDKEIEKDNDNDKDFLKSIDFVKDILKLFDIGKDILRKKYKKKHSDIDYIFHLNQNVLFFLQHLATFALHLLEPRIATMTRAMAALSSLSLRQPAKE